MEKKSLKGIILAVLVGLATGLAACGGGTGIPYEGGTPDGGALAHDGQGDAVCLHGVDPTAPPCSIDQ